METGEGQYPQREGKAGHFVKNPLSPRGGFARRLIAITNPPHTEDELWILGVQLDLAPKIAHIQLDDAGGIIIGPPNLLQQFLVSQYPFGVSGEANQESVLQWA